MVCAKCQKSQKQTKLATPEVKKKSEMYYGSGAGAGSSGTRSTGGGAKSGATLGITGVSKSKLLSKAAKNPYAAYSSNCDSCHTKTDAGKKYCTWPLSSLITVWHMANPRAGSKCAYQKNACPICGKSMANQVAGSKTPVVEGQKRTLK